MPSVSPAAQTPNAANMATRKARESLDILRVNARLCLFRSAARARRSTKQGERDEPQENELATLFFVLDCPIPHPECA